jgi:enterochelin esterase-like enzyme
MLAQSGAQARWPFGGGRILFGPQGFVVFALLVLLFAGALYWLVRVRHVALKVVAGVLAFPPAMMFGVALVNNFYGYYESWDDAWRDLTNQAPASVARVPDLGGRLDRVLREAVHKRQARKNGFALQTTLPGPQSRISRQGVIYLPPQYFQKPYEGRRFPVIELIHGSPGTPSDYEGRLKISGMLRKLISTHKAKPVVLVIPDANGGLDRSTQCLNTVHGEQDETYLAFDVPDDIAGRLRVERPGPAWGIAGFSEGGFCAANLALRHPDRYGAAASLSGYFEPLRSNHLPRPTDPFAGNRTLRAANSPLKVLASALPPSPLPHFWVMSGNAAQSDMVQAQAFVDLVKQYEPGAPFLVIKGGQHNYVAWREAFPKMFEWATSQV